MITAVVLVGSCVAAAFLYWAPRRDQLARAEWQANTYWEQLAAAQRERDSAYAQAVHARDQLRAAREHIQDLELGAFRTGLDVERLGRELDAVHEQLRRLHDVHAPEAGR